jgi:hypothetical protein
MAQADAESPAPSAEPEPSPRSLVGSVTFLVSDEELIEPLFADWEPDPIEE